MSKLIAARDYVLKHLHQTTPTGKSETVPGEAYTIRQLFDKLYTGMDPGVKRNGIFDNEATHDSADLNQVAHMDLYDQDQYKQSVKSDIKRFEEELQQHKAVEASKNAQEQSDYQSVLQAAKLLKSQPTPSKRRPQAPGKEEQHEEA